MKTSGEPQTFATGARRDNDTAKPRPDLISPLFEAALGQWLRDGAARYGDRNWEKGIPLSRAYASVRRHLLQWQLGMTDEPHMIAAACGCMFIFHTKEMIRRGHLPPELDDRTNYDPLPDPTGILPTLTKQETPECQPSPPK